MASEVSGASKPCPFCGEQILAIAIRCKHCQSNLTAPAVTPVKVPAGDGVGVMLVLLPWVGVFLVWFWVGESMLITASNNLAMTCVLVVLGSAILAAIDAHARGGSNPVGAFIAMAMIWFIYFPIYMHTRAKPGVPRRTVAAVIGMLAFLASGIYLGVLIEQRMAELRAVFDR